jgi:predicted AlkP superfamily phosphohydrolase/phosphomutase
VLQQEKMLDYEMNRFKEGLLGCVFFTTDRIQHIFWVTQDTEHPLYDREYAQKYGDVIPSYYRRMDTILGRLLSALDDRTALMVCSDHGFSSYRRSFHLNSWLVEQGLMALKEPVDPRDKEGGPLFRHVDWSKTRVYSLGFGSLYFNMKGREGKGTMSDPETRTLGPKVVDALTKVRDAKDGRPVVARVYTRSEIYRGPCAESSPDLIVGYHPGYRASWQTAIGGTPQGLFEDNLKKWSGDHCIDPAAVPGIFLSNFSINNNSPRNIDVAPTILNCLGLKPDEAMEGRSLI